jgi:predicted neuraminidase
MKNLAFAILALIAQIASATSWIESEEWLSPELEAFDCHSSNIIETSPGNFCALWKGGPGAGKCNLSIPENVGIWQSDFDGARWSSPREIVSSPKSVCWTPIVCKNQTGELLLFYRIGPDPRLVSSFLRRSFDEGKTWSQEEMLPAGIIGPTKTKPFFTRTGTLVSPSSVEVGHPADLYKATACWVEISEDNGHHWKKVGPLELPDRKFGVIEPTFFHDQEGHLRMLCRDRAHRIKEKGSIWMAISKDEGLHWSEFIQTPLPNPDSGIDVVDLGDGKIVLVYNHSHTHRFPLNAAVSLDGGDSWSEPFVLDEQGEFPSAILASDGFIHVTYAVTPTGQEQRRIKHIVVNPMKLMEQ